MVVAVLMAGGAAALLAAALPDTILAGDAEPYRERMADLFSGQIPYFDFPFEHLPGAVVPMALAWLLGGIDLQHYAFALSAVSLFLILLTALLIRRLESGGLGRGLAVRWLVLVIPLMPFLLFRNDSWPVALVVAAFVVAIGERSGAASGLIAFGIVSKFWPAAWAPIEWWRGRRKQAIGLAILAIGALILLRTDPVIQIQRPIGVHSETLAGSFFGLGRLLTGSPLEVVRTSAAYIDVPWWAHLINLIPGLVVGVVSIRAVRSAFSWPRAWLLTGSITGAIIIASPLLSTQYLSWLAPFSAAVKRIWVMALAVNVISLALIMTWDQLFEGRIWWWLLLSVRNVLLLVQILLLLGALAPRAVDQVSPPKAD